MKVRKDLFQQRKIGALADGDEASFLALQEIRSTTSRTALLRLCGIESRLLSTRP